MTERLLGGEPVRRAETSIPKTPIKLEIPMVNLGIGSSRFDVLYAGLKLNSLPDKVCGEWEI